MDRANEDIKTGVRFFLKSGTAQPRPKIDSLEHQIHILEQTKSSKLRR